MSGIIADNSGRSSGLVKAAGGGGKVLQVVGALDETTRSLNSTSWGAFGNTMTLTLTPAATSSKIWLVFHFAMWTGTQNVKSMVYRSIGGAGATALSTRSSMKADGGNSHHPFSSTAFYDSPNTTSECVYNIYFSVSGSNCVLNRGYNSGYDGIGQSIAMEIDGS